MKTGVTLTMSRSDSICEVKAAYLLGSEHVSEHRKQTPVTDAETHAVLSQHLKFTQLVKPQSYLRIYEFTQAASMPPLTLRRALT